MDRRKFFATGIIATTVPLLVGTTNVVDKGNYSKGKWSEDDCVYIAIANYNQTQIPCSTPIYPIFNKQGDLTGHYYKRSEIGSSGKGGEYLYLKGACSVPATSNLHSKTQGYSVDKCVFDDGCFHSDPCDRCKMMKEIENEVS